MYILLYFFVFFLVFSAVIIMFLISRNSKIKANCEQNLQLNNKVNNYLKENDIPITKTISIADYWSWNKETMSQKQIVVSSNEKKIALADYENNSLSIVNFNEILDYEIYENGSTVTFGGGGKYGMVSGLFGAETSGNCKDLRLIIRLKRYDKSQIVYDIISNVPLNVGVNKTSDIYRKCMLTLQEAASFFEVVKQENKDIA